MRGRTQSQAIFPLDIFQRLEEVFDRRRDIDRMIRLGHKLQDGVMMAFDQHSPVFIGFDWKGFDAKMEDVIGQLRSSNPYSVCPKCQGAGCDECGSRGWVNLEHWSRLLNAALPPPVEVA